jgi:hypothetical protein
MKEAKRRSAYNDVGMQIWKGEMFIGLSFFAFTDPKSGGLGRSLMPIKYSHCWQLQIWFEKRTFKPPVGRCLFVFWPKRVTPNGGEENGEEHCRPKIVARGEQKRAPKNWARGTATTGFCCCWWS